MREVIIRDKDTEEVLFRFTVSDDVVMNFVSTNWQKNSKSTKNEVNSQDASNRKTEESSVTKMGKTGHDKASSPEAEPQKEIQHPDNIHQENKELLDRDYDLCPACSSEKGTTKNCDYCKRYAKESGGVK